MPLAYNNSSSILYICSTCSCQCNTSSYCGALDPSVCWWYTGGGIFGATCFDHCSHSCRCHPGSAVTSLPVHHHCPGSVGVKAEQTAQNCERYDFDIVGAVCFRHWLDWATVHTFSSCSAKWNTGHIAVRCQHLYWWPFEEFSLCLVYVVWLPKTCSLNVTATLAML